MDRQKLIQRMSGIGLVLLISAGCSTTATPTPAPLIETSIPTLTDAVYRIRRLAPRHIINVDDHSLAEWSDSLAVVTIKPQDARNRQWKNIRGRTSQALSPNDIGITVYMASNAEYWYVALEAHDDKVLSGPPEYPYSGDCLEIFFAGKELDSDRDFHYHVIAPKSSDQASFFQLELLGGATGAKWDYFPEWRTDSRFQKNAVSYGFKASVWKTASGWNAEARIPLAALEADVRSRIDRGEALKMNIDYLDYDIRTATRTKKDDWGFWPDNVFGLDSAEENINKPKYMRSVIFEWQPLSNTPTKIQGIWSSVCLPCP